MNEPALQYFENEFEPRNEAELDEILRRRLPTGEGAFWFLRDHTPVLGLFITGEKACLYSDEHDLWSHNPDYRGKAEDETAKFLLENYEESKMPAAAVIPAAHAVQAFKHYWKTNGELTRAVNWSS